MTTHSKNEVSTQYYGFLLRIWRPNGQAQWRVMVESIETNIRKGFSSIDEAFLFIREQTSADLSLSDYLQEE